jgi:hypothetical protein
MQEIISTRIKIVETHSKGINVPDRKIGPKQGMTTATIPGTTTVPMTIRGVKPIKGGALTSK